ncbi:hypothetical protein [Rubrivirga sp. IMCC45206]|uniref:hypothetical protein n=1 Tax=Rubrivirga sp. IMCC45206 TaxID=3391614 RepID=UPI00398F93B8
MPFHLTTLPESRIGLAVGSGRVSGEDLAAACTAMVAQDGWVAGFDEIWDLSETTEVDVTPGDLAHLIATMRGHADALGEGRVACVTTRDAIAVLVRLIEALTIGMGRHFHTVRSRAEAAEWLGLDAEVLETATPDRRA